MNLSEVLNPAQAEAAAHIDGPLLVLAGAGSGKTRVLTHKIAYLVQEVGLPAENILAVTFTNKAADEMKQRVQQLLNMDVSTMSVGTFHSISARILRREIQLLDYSNDFVIYDQDDSRALVKKVIGDLQLDEKSFVPKAVQAQISNAKNKMIRILITCPPMLGMIDSFRHLFEKYDIELTTPHVEQLMSVDELIKIVPQHEGWIDVQEVPI